MQVAQWFRVVRELVFLKCAAEQLTTDETVAAMDELNELEMQTLLWSPASRI